MTNRKMQKKLVVVADDFTGANDTGVQFTKVGLRVKVIIDSTALITHIEQCDVIVIDLESRLVSPQEAYNRSFSVGQQLLKIGNCTVYKKVDSTFRGNIGAELDGLMDSLQLKIALLAAAMPVFGRTTENGEVYVHGVKLADTEAAKDPRTPVKHSRIQDIIGIQSKRICREIPTEFLKDEPGEISDFLERDHNNGKEIFIFDSREEGDLEKIAGSINSIHFAPFLLAGSAGFASHLSKTSLFCPKPIAFVFAGSVSEKTRVQIKVACNSANTQLLLIEGERLLNGNVSSNDIIEIVSASIANGTRRFIFTSALNDEDVAGVYQFAKERNVANDKAAEKLSVEMGHLAATLISEFNPNGVLLTGGETAINTVKALGATGIDIEQEILPGIQSGTLTGCSLKSVVVTKAGGFGEADAISKVFQFFKV